MNVTRSVIATLKNAMKAKGYVYQDLADKTGMSPAWVGKLFRGGNKRLKDHQIAALEAALDISFGFRVVAKEDVSPHALEMAQRIEKEPVYHEMVDLMWSLLEMRKVGFVQPDQMQPLGELIQKITRQETDPVKVSERVLQAIKLYV